MHVSAAMKKEDLKLVFPKLPDEEIMAALEANGWDRLKAAKSLRQESIKKAAAVVVGQKKQEEQKQQEQLAKQNNKK